MLLCDVQLINSYICKPLDLLVAETALEKKLHRQGGRGPWEFLQKAWCPSCSSPIYWRLMRGSSWQRSCAAIRHPPNRYSRTDIQQPMPVFPDMTPDTKLSDFIGEHSYMLFDLLDLSC